MGILKEFQEFAMKGNVIDLAIGVVIGAAFSKIVSSLVEFVITPAMGIIMKGANFADLSFGIGDAQIKYGMFIQAVIDFAIVAFVLFMVVKMLNSAKKRMAKKEKVQEAKVTPLTKDQQLLSEIKDLLQKRK